MYYPHTICRACENESLVEVFDLGIQPMANDFSKPGAESPGYAPLRVLFCPRCTLSQLSVVVPPKILYTHYPYVTSRSETMKAHFEALWAVIKTECNPESVLEIGSNDGHFLKFCKEHGADAVMGIDPAENLKPSASDTGIISITSVFDDEAANIAKSALPPINLVIAGHVFAHMDDWKSFVRHLDIVCNKETLVVIEVPDALDLINNVELDTIYHEHLSYVSVQSVEALLKHTQFHLHDVRHFPIHGGAMVLMLRRNDSSQHPKSIQYEPITLSMWQDFRNYANSAIRRLKFQVEELILGGKRVCGFGASAKSTVWISACGFSRNHIEFICDCTPQKQGAYSPGTDIPIVRESMLMERMPDYAILFSWSFRDEIVARNKAYLNAGGHFIVPGKKLEWI